MERADRRVYAAFSCVTVGWHGVSYLCNYSPPAPGSCSRTCGEPLPGAASPSADWNAEGSSLVSGWRLPHSCWDVWPGLLLSSALQRQEDHGSIQPAHLVLFLPPTGSTSGIIGFVLAHCKGLWQGIVLHVQGCVSGYTGSKAREEGFWVAVFLEAGFSRWCYRVVQSPAHLVQTVRWDQNSKN